MTLLLSVLNLNIAEMSDSPVGKNICLALKM